MDSSNTPREDDVTKTDASASSASSATTATCTPQCTLRAQRGDGTYFSACQLSTVMLRDDSSTTTNARPRRSRMPSRPAHTTARVTSSGRRGRRHRLGAGNCAGFKLAREKRHPNSGLSVGGQALIPSLGSAVRCGPRPLGVGRVRRQSRADRGRGPKAEGSRRPYGTASDTEALPALHA